MQSPRQTRYWPLPSACKLKSSKLKGLTASTQRNQISFKEGYKLCVRQGYLFSWEKLHCKSHGKNWNKSRTNNVVNIWPKAPKEPLRAELATAFDNQTGKFLIGIAKIFEFILRKVVSGSSRCVRNFPITVESNNLFTSAEGQGTWKIGTLFYIPGFCALVETIKAASEVEW